MGDIRLSKRNNTSQHNKRRHCRIILRNIDMPNCILTGKIYLLTLPPDEKNRALSFFKDFARDFKFFNLFTF